ncbi:phage derived Gp49-like protein DUF891 [Xenorhabdus cabanillasii]|uniref:Phage derived Gp49-like protein DUF891 n=1 Tax=Xenorhabdus cabanillasii TaxID=351673 RepID=A0A3D9U8H7_9GAMM|nr:phage derived Gp49-like protein DUF891 [Xenorhabdus cabanillasii]
MFQLEFHLEVLNEISRLNKIIKAKVLNALDKLEMRGYELRYPDTKPIQGQLLELRTNGKDVSRTFLHLRKTEKSIFFVPLSRKVKKHQPQKLNWH